ncbi:DUF4089 domain-containing protein [Acetobacter oeni]|uniref:DUF4089 domain-containing protein n=1 Tax=Acetobacter oeni TaxID=304077 RepID=A0A511XID8_9PROT|nr:DUF4089 domain-containing protein [Acetobacter oeni]MBB3881404.1 hypothetical protein [Acetobacter oeni]GBR11096.1 hypothetical protein AA21952_3265 [Acetobacter oeni LMG 21952]GEN62681.1 hypothetical protein AOE01nite_09050 [Acetobacter oeni]
MAGIRSDDDDKERAAVLEMARDVAVLARQVDLVIPDDCLPGVIFNIETLRGYVALVDGLVLPDDCEPAFGYVP